LQSDKANQKLDDETWTIPVVVHILHHPSLSIGEGSNIAESQVHQAIAHLNEALQNRNDYQTNHGVSTEIEFCLASKNEVNAATTGINRFPTIEFSEIDMGTEEPEFKSQTIRWNSHDYLNIWVVDEICSPSIPDNPCGVVGYSYTAQVHGSARDGVVIEAGRFGSTVDGSKVLVHEVGHYLNLQHTFHEGCKNDNCLMDGDFVCDTPPENSTSGVDCSKGEHENSCTSDSDDTHSRNPFRPQQFGGLGDQNDFSNNYMDYNYKDCLDSFTEGQKDRMRISLTTTRKSLLESAKCSEVIIITPPDDTADAGISKILTPNGFTCKNYVVLEVELSNFSDKPLTSVNIHYQVNGGNTQVYFWQGTLSENQSVAVALPKTLSITENIQTIRAYTTYPNSVEDENADNNTAEADFFNMLLQQLPFFDDFEGENLGAHWSIHNPDGLQSWQTQAAQNCDANERQSLALNSHSYANQLEESDLLQLHVNLENLAAAELRFDVAYVAYSVGFAETLRVFASKDCGESYLKIYEKRGLELATSNAYQTQDWHPKDCNDWRTEIVDLSQFAGAKTQLYFEAINRNGNNLFLDNISIDNKTQALCDAPSNLSIEVTMADRATLNWSGKSNVFAYNVWFKPVDTEDWTVVTIETGGEKIVTGLQPSTTYEMQLQSICADGGTSLFSNPQFFQTLSLPACHSPLQQRVETIQSNSALLRWEQAGASENYTVRYRKLGSNNWSLAFGKKDSTEVRNLIPETVYEAAVRSKCVNGISGNSEYGSLLTFKTTAECPAPSQIEVVSTSIDKATIAFTPAPESNFVNFKYRAKNVTQWTDGGTTNLEEHTFNGLKSGTVYEVQGAGICGSQQGNFSRSAVFSTETLCNAPKNFSHTYNPSTNLVIINWEVAEDADLYELEYKQILPTEGSEWKSIVVGSTTAYLSNLEQGSTYHYKVRSQCADNAPSVQNNSYFSDIQSFAIDIRCDVPFGLKTDVVGSEYAQLSWNDSNQNNSFQVRYRMQLFGTWEFIDASENKVELFNLKPDTNYEFEVRAQCGTFSTAFSPAFSFKTKDDICSISPTDLEAVEIKNRSATLYWLDSGSSTEYTFAYRISNQGLWTEVVVNNRYVVLEDLQPCFIYEYRVASICENGQSEFSPPSFFATECVSYCTASS
ncbi:MAG: fibronectin type III domain-containing protein, partial [Chitinophagales bacterium]